MNGMNTMVTNITRFLSYISDIRFPTQFILDPHDNMRDMRVICARITFVWTLVSESDILYVSTKLKHGNPPGIRQSNSQ